MRALAAVVCVLVPGAAIAQPRDTKTLDEKSDAKALMASGLKLFAAKDYLGALAVFQNAYARFPSAKILLNIATTQKQLGRSADAANSYALVLAASDVDAARKAEVSKVLAELDATVGIVAVSVQPATAELSVGDGAWRPPGEVRVPPGDVVLHARAERHQPVDRTLAVAAGKRVEVALALVAIPEAAPVSSVAVVAPSGGGVRATVEPEAPLSRFGAIALGNFDVVHKGGAAVVGVTALLVPHVSLEAAAILGPTIGGYLGGRLSLLDGAVHPLLAVGLPVFASSGGRFAVRAAGGIELAVTRHLMLIAEVGVEHVFNPQANVAATVLVPALGASARL